MSGAGGLDEFLELVVERALGVGERALSPLGGEVLRVAPHVTGLESLLQHTRQRRTIDSRA